MLNRYFKVTKENQEFLYANIAVKNIYFALVSLDYIFDPSRDNYNIGIYHDEHTYYFFHLQSILTACGNISNVFYNHCNKKSTERSRKLRKELDIFKKEFPLVFQKEIRNTNEHFDERYEEFGGCMGDYNILDKDTDDYMRAVIQTNPHLRTFDKEQFVYITYNRSKDRIEYDLKELRKELKSMLERITGNSIFESGWTQDMPNECVQ